MPDEHNSKLRNTAGWIFLLGATVLTVVALSLVVFGAKRYPEFYAVAVRHFPTVIGLPFAAIASLFIVTACRIAIGDKLNFKMFGLEFSGAGGPVVLWVFCFLAIALAINATWDNSYSGPIGKTLSERLEPNSSAEIEMKLPSLGE